MVLHSEQNINGVTMTLGFGLDKSRSHDEYLQSKYLPCQI